MHRLTRAKKQSRDGFLIILCAAGSMIFAVCLSFPNSVQAQNATLRGTVTFDETHLAGVVVTAVSTQSKQEKSAVTDAKGAYEIKGLYTATYLLTVSNTPYVLREGIGGTFYQLQIETAGVAVRDFKMTEGAVIAGCAEFPSKQPVVEREVIYEKTDFSVQGFSPMGFRSRTVTDDQGCFRLYGLPTGHYRVGLGKPVGVTYGTSPLPFSTTYYPGVRSQSDAEVMKVIAGQEYKLGSLVVKDRLNTFSVTGSLIDQDTGSKIPNFVFELGRYEGTAVISTTPLKTNDAGDFKIIDLFEGRYRAQPNVRYKNNATNYTCSPFMFDIMDRDLIGVNIHCTSLAAGIKGEVIINNSVSAGNQDCTVALKEGNSIDDSNATLYRVTLEQGRFNLSGLRRGMYTLVIMPLRPSLQYEQAQVGQVGIRNTGAFGILRIDLTSGDQTVKIFLTGR